MPPIVGQPPLNITRRVLLGESTSTASSGGLSRIWQTGQVRRASDTSQFRVYHQKVRLADSEAAPRLYQNVVRRRENGMPNPIWWLVKKWKSSFTEDYAELPTDVRQMD